MTHTIKCNSRDEAFDTLDNFSVMSLDDLNEYADFTEGVHDVVATYPGGAFRLEVEVYEVEHITGSVLNHHGGWEPVTRSGGYSVETGEIEEIEEPSPIAPLFAQFQTIFGVAKPGMTI